MRLPLIALFTLLAAQSSSAHDEHTSEWNYFDERWPSHIGPLIEEADPDAYIHRIIGLESTRINGWSGRQGALAFDAVTACGLHFDGYIRQRPRGTYVVLVVSSADKKDHQLKWIPVEYRLDNERPQYFARRDGSPNQEAPRPGINAEIKQQEDIPTQGGRPDPKTDPAHRLKLKYLFDNNSPQRELRTRGGVTINAKYKYIEVLKFAEPKQLASHDWIQIYLPWVDGCPTKPDLVFKRNKQQEVVWDDHLRAWLSAGTAFMLPYHEAGWVALHPQPSLYLRFAYLWWQHHGFTLEGHMVPLHQAAAGGGDVTGFLTRASYGYAFWLHKYLTLSAEAGYRGVAGGIGLYPGLGGGLNLAWEVPGTRHPETGQRLIFETGCEFEKHFTGIVNFHDLKGAWAHCKFGIGLGW